MGDYVVGKIDFNGGNTPTERKHFEMRKEEFATSESKTMSKTLRDEFAMAALTGLLSRQDLAEKWVKYAETAYILADAMMKAREISVDSENDKA